MKEQFDKKLADKIKDSFENHSESYDPVQWKKLSEAYFQPKATSKPIWGWLVTGIAASLVIGLLVFSQFSGLELEPEFEGNLSLVDSVKQNDQDRVVSGNSPIKEDVPVIENDEIATSKDEDVKKQSTGLSYRDIKQQNTETLSVQEVVKENSIIQESKQPKGNSDKPNITMNPLVAEFKPEFTLELPKLAEINLENETDRKAALIPQFDQKNLNISPLEQKSSLLAEDTEKAQQTIMNWLYEANIQGEDKLDTKGGNEKSMRLGVILAPQTISNNTQSMNLGAGVLSEFSFTKRLKLDVGVAYARQSINPSINNEVRSMSNVQYSSDVSRSSAFASNFVNASYELSFGQLEIPLNLKYKLLENKGSDFYLITGVSSMVYMNQKNIGTFTSANFNTAGLMQVNQTVQVFTETATPSSSDSGSEMNVGQMLNFSLGYEYSLKNGTFISLEPFYKMSMGGQTFINQQFGIGGLNLRMNFQLKK
ncbi:PorT family protein [Belliella sp. R4-6]|uniref:PorT family protein n=1 Tax=Belliella alkalica TaxID=1730871 RepID=A0ABS9V8N0_9BACT|nr:outer membrane beta-barrel protein [Belliella alkalica]MCH7412782.1 PorT family protein [Belliella alkalica]